MKEKRMQISLKRTLVLALLILALLTVLMAGIIRSAAVAAPFSAHQVGPQLAIYCPAPPVSC